MVQAFVFSWGDRCVRKVGNNLSPRKQQKAVPDLRKMGLLGENKRLSWAQDGEQQALFPVALEHRADVLRFQLRVQTARWRRLLL